MEQQRLEVKKTIPMVVRLRELVMKLVFRRLDLLLNSIKDQHPIEILDELLFENNSFCCEVIPSGQGGAININRMKTTYVISQNDSIALLTSNLEDKLKKIQNN